MRSLKPILYFIAISLALALLWEGYKLLAAPGGTYTDAERVKLHRQLLAEQRSVPVAVFA